MKFYINATIIIVLYILYITIFIISYIHHSIYYTRCRLSDELKSFALVLKKNICVIFRCPCAISSESGIFSYK